MPPDTAEGIWRLWRGTRRAEKPDYRREFSRAKIPGGISGQGINMLVPTLLELGTEEQKQKYIEPTLTGEMVWCQGYSEPGAGSDLAALRTSAVLEGDHFVVNGQKIWTSTRRRRI